MSGTAIVLQAGLASRPDDGKEFRKIALDTDALVNAFFLAATDPYPPPGTQVSWDGHTVTWSIDGKTYTVKHHGWIDDRGRFLGVPRQVV